MHGSSDKQPRDSESVYRSWTIKPIALPILFVVAVIAFAVSHPEVSKSISDAVQAELPGTDFLPDFLRPTRTAQPSNQIRIVKAY